VFIVLVREHLTHPCKTWRICFFEAWKQDKKTSLGPQVPLKNEGFTPPIYGLYITPKHEGFAWVFLWMFPNNGRFYIGESHGLGGLGLGGGLNLGCPAGT